MLLNSVVQERVTVNIDAILAANNILSQLGILLKLPMTAIATAQSIYTRFSIINSPTLVHSADAVLASMFLACKVEECGRRIRDIVNVYYALKMFKESSRSHGLEEKVASFVDIPFDVMRHILKAFGLIGSTEFSSTQTYNEYKDGIISQEMHILASLGFFVHVQHPHGFMISYLQSLGLADSVVKINDGAEISFSQFCWNYLNDLVRTEVIVYYQPHVVACAVIFYAAKKCGIALPSSPPWWELFDAKIEDIEIVCEHIVLLYQRKF